MELDSTFPQTSYVTMVSADTTKILGKLKEFNENEMSGDGLRLTEPQLQQINELVNGDFNKIEDKIELLLQLLKWPIGTYTMSTFLSF